MMIMVRCGLWWLNEKIRSTTAHNISKWNQTLTTNSARFCTSPPVLPPRLLYAYLLLHSNQTQVKQQSYVLLDCAADVSVTLNLNPVLVYYFSSAVLQASSDWYNKAVSKGNQKKGWELRLYSVSVWNDIFNVVRICNLYGMEVVAINKILGRLWRKFLKISSISLKISYHIEDGQCIMNCLISNLYFSNMQQQQKAAIVSIF